MIMVIMIMVIKVFCDLNEANNDDCDELIMIMMILMIMIMVIKVFCNLNEATKAKFLKLYDPGEEPGKTDLKWKVCR